MWEKHQAWEEKSTEKEYSYQNLRVNVLTGALMQYKKQVWLVWDVPEQTGTFHDGKEDYFPVIILIQIFISK